MTNGSRHRWCVSVWLAAVAMAAPALAVNENWMGAGELEDAFKGETIAGVYEDGRRFEETYREGGGLAYLEGPRRQAGDWSIVEGTFCTIYRGDASGGCYRVARIGANCFEFYFVARTVAQVQRKESDRPGWTARAWRKGEPDTCTEVPIV